MKFDVKTAIRVLRKAGYHEQAMFLAEKHRVQSDYLRVLLEDLQQYNKALQYISTLDFAEVSVGMLVVVVTYVRACEVDRVLSPSRAQRFVCALCYFEICILRDGVYTF